MKMLNSKIFLAATGILFGIGAILLAAGGNPANMAICVACFIRDTAGALKLHTTETVQYLRPEIVGFILGSFLIALATKEFKVTAGSSPVIRFVLGFIMMVGALVFLGCPLRMVIRMAAGDLNAYVALIGFAGGIATGCFFLKKGFSLGRAYEVKPANGFILPGIMVLVFVISLCTSVFAVSQSGPGSKHAPVIAALVIALIIGAVGQKNRVCFAGSIRDIILMKNFNLICIIGGLYVTMLAYNLITGGFKLSFTGQPIAHARHIWNILGMYAVGFAAVLAGGCPLRQLILAGQGSTDSAITFLGMLIGAAFAHNFKLAGAAATAATETAAANPGGPGQAGRIVLIVCIAVLFAIAAANCRRRAKGGNR